VLRVSAIARSLPLRRPVTVVGEGASGRRITSRRSGRTPGAGRSEVG
jgi:hypothetical protein